MGYLKGKLAIIAIIIGVRAFATEAFIVSALAFLFFLWLVWHSK